MSKNTDKTTTADNTTSTPNDQAAAVAAGVSGSTLQNEIASTDAVAPAQPASVSHFPDNVQVDGMRSDVRSFWAADDAGALAVAGDIIDPSNVPAERPQTDEASASFNKRRAAYIKTLQTIYSMRGKLDAAKVFTPPVEGSGDHALWSDYAGQINQARDLRLSLV